MYCDSSSADDPAVIIRQSAASLRTLPQASEVTFPGVFAWSPVSSATVTAALGVDPGAWNVWRNRRLTPAPLPPAWFRPASGSPLIYQVSGILTWLAARRGEQLDILSTWRQSLLTDFETDVSGSAEVRRLAVLYARTVGLKAGGVTFTSAGFEAYLSSITGHCPVRDIDL